VIQPHDWLSPGDMLLATQFGSNHAGQFSTNSSLPYIFVGPPTSSPPRPGAYYAFRICQRACDAETAIFSSRTIRHINS